MTAEKSTLVTDIDKEVFEQVAEIWDNLRKNVLGKESFKPIELISKWLQVLTGSYMYLTTRYTAARIARDNNEVAIYMRLKNDAVAADTKFVSAPADREARSEVSELVEFERVFESYQKAAEQGILTLKKLLEIQVLELQQESK